MDFIKASVVITSVLATILISFIISFIFTLGDENSTPWVAWCITSLLSGVLIASEILSQVM